MDLTTKFIIAGGYMEKNLHENHRKRMRERFIINGLDGFQEHEIIEFLLFYILPRKNTNEIAHVLINKFGSVSGVLKANVDELIKINGLSEKSALFLKLILDFCEDYYVSQIKSDKLCFPENMKSYFEKYFDGMDKEVLVILKVNMDLQVMEKTSIPLFQVQPDSKTKDYIIDQIYKIPYKKVIIGHNRLDERIMPYENDYSVVKFLSEAFGALNIEICDYVIYSKNMTILMKHSGAFDFKKDMI